MFFKKKKKNEQPLAWTFNMYGLGKYLSNKMNACNYHPLFDIEVIRWVKDTGLILFC